MREFEFVVTYDEGADDLMDVYIDNPSLSSHTRSCHVTGNTMWRVDEVTGPREALGAYDRALEGLSRCSSLRGMGGCEVDWEYEVLGSYPTGRVVYSRQSEGRGCRSIPYLAAEYLGDGLLLRARQRHGEYRWQILAADDAAMSDVYDELDRNLREGLTLEFDRVEHASDWHDRRPAAPALSVEQREAIELAVAYGYYERPRRASLQEIADSEGLPTSTLQYRVTRAEAGLARAFLADEAGAPARSPAATGSD
ncbi:helix-turn-helix domain-containing protein [Candidatus Halobonum tyrrellensis]|uniref:Bacterio-opsin activator HTH domain-containing protein n=1 Tax=Candidatus Halobonum tyrrellensis G22 TaxID=1324957 RepID=V4HJ06_9EURY|nr:helix-turn-helix domain-containing protein [Candidatus Halobonum tyrrellensis]ESP89768.1 bacterio-opsin activator HTH domain-containing protein [Candidatus Halobonum tyrrellensis G22]